VCRRSVDASSPEWLFSLQSIGFFAVLLIFSQRTIVRGIVQNWEDFKLLLSHVFFDEIKIKKEAV
jgi:hypothetical protein